MNRSKRFLLSLAIVLALGGATLSSQVVQWVQATVNEVSAANRYTANGSTTVFAYSFKILTKADIEVLVDGIAKSVDTDYTVGGLGASGGGNVTFITAPANLANVTLLRKQKVEQQSIYTPNEPFPATRLEKDYDKNSMVDQQQTEALLRALKFGKKSTKSNIDVPDPEADKYLKWNSAATGLTNAGIVPSGSLSSPVARIEGGTGSANGFNNVVFAADSATYCAAVSAIGANVRTLIVASSVNETAGCTVPSNVTTEFIGTGQLNISPSITVTINGPVIAPPRQIFSGSGTVIVGPDSVPVLLAQWFGVSAGAADNGAALSAAIKAAMGTQGSIRTRGMTIQFTDGNYVFTTNPFGVLPNDGAVGSVPAQASLRITGAGSGAQATGTIGTNAATQLDLQYTTSNNAKLDTRGKGLLEIDHLTLKDTVGGDTKPFIHTTNTIIKIHDVEFIGTRTGSSADQDAIILGGTTTNVNETATAAFQGYGSQIYNNHFQKIRRAVYLRVYANGVPIYHNTVWNTCGFTTGAAFEYDGNPAATATSISGTPIHHNLIEMVSYKYGVQVKETSASTFGPNDFYDPTATTTAYYTFGTNTTYNTVIGGQHTDSKTFVEETGSAVGTNSWYHSHQSQSMVFAGSFPIFKNGVTISNLTGATNPSILYVLSAKAALDFTALAANTCETFDIAVTGAVVGDPVFVGVTNALAQDGGASQRTVIWGWVTSANTVRVRRCNITGTVTADPAAADVTVVVFKPNV